MIPFLWHCTDFKILNPSSLTLDHVDVVGSIADGQSDRLLVALHQTHHVGLLFGGDTAADDSAALTGHVYKVTLSHLLLRVVDGLAVLRVGGGGALPETAQTQTTALLLLLVQNLVLQIKAKRREKEKARCDESPHVEQLNYYCCLLSIFVSNSLSCVPVSLSMSHALLSVIFLSVRL